jgi:hypothetical protein
MFVWLLHPCTTLPPVWTWWVAAIMVTVAVAGTVVAWMITFGRSGRDQVVRRIERKLAKEIRRGGRLGGDLLFDLEYLGAKGEAGGEKALVLDSLRRLAEEIQSRPGYEGDELGDLVMGLGAVIGNGDELVLGRNLETGREVLEEILRRCARIRPRLGRDQRAAKGELERIAIRALRNREWSTFPRAVQSSGFDGAMLFRVGVRALQCEREDLAVAALAKLETLVANRRPAATAEDEANLLGLDAEIWSRGESGIARVRDFRKANPTVGVTVAGLDAAIGYFQAGLVFGTADKLRMQRKNATEGVVPNPVSP